MRIRAVGRAERASLQPWRQPWTQPYRRSLDAGEIGELVHLYRSRQESREAIAKRYGVSIRTIHRYIAEYPDTPILDPAAARVLNEAHRTGIRITPWDAQRLAAAALLERGAA